MDYVINGFQINDNLDLITFSRVTKCIVKSRSDCNLKIINISTVLYVFILSFFKNKLIIQMLQVWRSTRIGNAFAADQLESIRKPLSSSFFSFNRRFAFLSAQRDQRGHRQNLHSQRETQANPSRVFFSIIFLKLKKKKG